MGPARLGVAATARQARTTSSRSTTTANSTCSDMRDYTIQRERYGVTADLDFTASTRPNYYLRGLWTNYIDTEIRRAKGNVVEDDEIERATRDRIRSRSSTPSPSAAKTHRRVVGHGLPPDVEQVAGRDPGPGHRGLHPGGRRVHHQRHPRQHRSRQHPGRSTERGSGRVLVR